MRSEVFAFTVGSVVVACLAAGGASADIGAVSAVNRDMDGTPPASTSRPLELGNQVVRDERIRTSDIGSGQIIFRDQTSISIAPRSDLVLDSYVYDADAATGEVAISLTKGALRFIGGRITKSRDAVIRTPTATIGIRGGMSIIRVAESGATSVIQIAGERTIVTGIDGQKVTLSRSNAKAEVSPSGQASYAGLADSKELAPVIRSFEGGGSGGSDAGNQETQIESGTQTVAKSNSQEQGGAERAPISTSGEKQVEKSEKEKETLASDPNVVGKVQTSDVVTTPVTPTTNVILPSDGTMISTLAGPQSFTSVTLGSLIGTTAAGDVMHVPVPGSSADFDTTLFGLPAPSFRARSLYPNTGFTEIDHGAGMTLTGFVDPAGFGFSDLGIGFHVFQVFEGSEGSGHEALVLFGTPTPGQAANLASDAGTFPPRTNTASGYVIEPEFDLGTDGGGELLFMIANGGEPRFAPAGASIPANGGKVLGGSVQIDIDPATDEQFSDFSVFAHSIGFEGGGPRLDGEIFETEVGGTFRRVRLSNVSSLSDQSGNTVFGPNGRYMFVSSPMVAAPGGGFFLDAGEEHDLGQASTDPEPILNLLTLDPTHEHIVNQPLALAQHSGSRAAGSTGLASGQFDAFHAAGFAACSDGECGQLISPGVSTGLYSARTGTTAVSGGIISFENGLTGTDTNEVIFNMGLESDPVEVNILAGGNTFEFAVGAADNAGSAYLDDAHFALSTSTNITAGAQSTNADFLVASSGATGDGGIFVGQNPNGFSVAPLNARWGWWSASFDVVSGRSSSTREDLFHMGAWVAGVRPDLVDIPISGVVAFGGVAIGTEADLSTSVTRVVGGDFELSYDFGIGQGNFRMNIAGLSINETAFGAPGDNRSYSINASSPVQFQADGTFFSGPSSAVAATGGDFQIDDPGANRQIVGVFVGDAQ